MIIDAHCHLAPPEAPGVPALKDVDAFLERKAQDGIDLAVVVHSIVNIPGLGGVLDRVKRWNEFALGVREQHPERVAVMVGVDPFVGAEMLEEARRAVALGSRGFTVSSSVEGRRLDDPEVEDLWSLAEELDVPVFIHPPVGPGEPGDPRLAEFGNRAVDVGLSLAAAIFAGVLDRHPTLRLVAASGGGGVAALAGRLDAAYRIPELAGAALGPPAPPAEGNAKPDGGPFPRQAPSSYLRRIYIDTLMFSEPALRCALEVFGPDRLLFGTDWPPVAIPASVSLDLIRGWDIPEDVRAGILGGNAAELLGLPLAG
ncbi:MAG TPA: amidohydrolase family protein [Solirubrobacteraceae bacterium]|jgi:aminocarboxymuconate-semialdehyde decarboxylase